MLMARVKADFRFQVVTACSGQEFTKLDWRPVKAGYESEAAAHPYLEVKSFSPSSSPAKGAGVTRIPAPAGKKAERDQSVDSETVARREED